MELIEVCVRVCVCVCAHMRVHARASVCVWGGCVCAGVHLYEGMCV